jgi:hypothetical protein
MVRKFLLSDDYHYHYEALDYLIANGYEEYLTELVHMLNHAGPFVTRRAVRLFPQAWLEDEPFQSAVTAAMVRFDYRAQEIWMERMMGVRVYGSALDELTGDLTGFSQQQLQEVLILCEKNRNGLSVASLDRLGELLQHENEEIASQCHGLLKKLAKENRNAKKILRHYEKNKET